MKDGKILVIDDDEAILLTAKVVLKKEFNQIRTENNPDNIITELQKDNYDVILLDMNFSTGATSGKEGLFWLKKILGFDPSLNVIMITAYGDIDLAVKAMKEGAIDFVVKPWENKKLIATILSAYKLSQSKKEIKELRSKQKVLSKDIDLSFSEIIGKSSAIQKLFATINKVGKTDVNVLILGENGTGKELVARALHRQSLRAGEIFISVDLGAIAETLFESELFGYVKGAYTDAREDREGRFEIASGAPTGKTTCSNSKKGGYKDRFK